ncbi:MAG TPA: GNAT family N-acetyltransferase [Streptosporangiaceae bacterium]
MPGDDQPADGVHIGEVGVPDADLLRELYELECRAFPIDRPALPLPTRTEVMVDWARPYPGTILASLQARAGGRLAGYARISLPVMDNTASGHVEITVHPDLRRRGIGRRLAVAAAGQVRQQGRKVAIGTARSGQPGDAFAAAIGAVAQQEEVRNILDLDHMDPAAVAALGEQARAQSAAYAVESFTGPTPPDLLPAVATMLVVMNDAPQESAAMEDETWTPERVAGVDQWHAARGSRLYSILARPAGSTEPAGLTRVAVRPEGDLAFQLETGVATADRGHLLGSLLKVTMLEWLTSTEPQVRRINTFNAASNAHMLAINEKLGFVPAERWRYFDLAL